MEKSIFSALRSTKWGETGCFPSPILFSIYIGELLLKLESSGLECYVGNIFVGTLGYADDLTLLSSSVRCLNRMLKICESFAIGTNEVKHLGNTVTVVYRHERLYDEKVTVHLCGKHVYRKLRVYSKSNLMLLIWILLLYFLWIPVVGLQF